MPSDNLRHGYEVTMHTGLEYQNTMVTDGKAAVSLQDLPIELVAQVLTHVADIETLDSLIRAWPAAYRVFECSAVDITEAVLSSGYASGYVCGHIRVIFRIIALLRSGTLPISSLADFQRRVIIDAMRSVSRVRSSRNGFAPDLLARETPPAVIRSLLATYRQVMSASLGCLTYYLDSFKTLEPEHPIDKGIKNPNPAWSQDISTWQSRPQGRKFNIRDVGPPSWTEEQRVNRAFWRLQLLYDLKRAASRGLLDWPDDSKAALCDIVAVSRPIGEYANYWLRTRRYAYTTWAGSSDFYHAWVHDIPYAAHKPCPPEYEELISVVDYVRAVHGQEASERLVKGEVCLAELQGPVEIYREWSLAKPGVKDWKTLIGPSVGAERHYRGPQGRSILDMVDFDPLGRYGFAFWSWERMFAYGLATRSHSEFEDYRVTYAWESILSPEEVARAEWEMGKMT
ncbi:hypothetical protein T069G_07652 [Trichoderma breve]|uniref:F-box domain-containing protein n=1 Tax=Trichoderma breve TaxID=2034170 RepID=A0A9W9E6L4_9HYPO|nr:hypothetical protein T069G_07652 [Trichoderma breve]KAJ4859385.1 hypothetical protein T069G_07652 [Trichoderma breve]